MQKSKIVLTIDIIQKYLNLTPLKMYNMIKYIDKYNIWVDENDEKQQNTNASE